MHGFAPCGIGASLSWLTVRNLAAAPPTRPPAQSWPSEDSGSPLAPGVFHNPSPPPGSEVGCGLQNCSVLKTRVRSALETLRGRANSDTRVREAEFKFCVMLGSHGLAASSSRRAWCLPFRPWETAKWMSTAPREQGKGVLISLWVAFFLPRALSSGVRGASESKEKGRGDEGRGRAETRIL